MIASPKSRARGRSALVAVLLLGSACGQPARPSETVHEAPVRTSAAASAAAPVRPASPARNLVMVRGAVIDVAARQLLIEPTTDPVLEGTVTDSTVYLRIGTKETAQELRSYRLDDGKLTWSVTLLEPGEAPGVPGESYCRQLAAGPAGVFCVTNGGVRLFAKEDGAASDVISSRHVHSIEALGDRIAVLLSGETACSARCIESETVEVIDAKTGEALAHRKLGGRVERTPIGFLSSHFPGPTGYQAFVPRGRELCLLSTWARPVTGGITSDNLDVRCFDHALAPRIQMRERFEGAALTLVNGGRRWIVVANAGKGPPSYLVDLEKPGLEESSVPISAVIANDEGVIDALVVPPKVIERSGAPRFDLPFDATGSISGLRTKDVIVLSHRDPASKSVLVTAVDATSGAERWLSEIAVRPATSKRDKWSHWIDLDGDALIVRGAERSQEYLAALSLADGNKLIEVVRPR